VGPITTAKPVDKTFVDFQNDVSVSDIDLAHLEGYQSVEHLKRYTTLGMGTDQGKTSNLNALAIMAAADAVEGELQMRFRDRTELVRPGEFIIVPRGVEPCPYAEHEAQVLLFEPASTVNTGTVVEARTRDAVPAV
jgi:hypothetical protein